MNHAKEVTEAIVFVLSGRLLPDADRCIRHCITQGYEMVGVVRDDWSLAMEYLADGRASVLVVASDRDLDPDRAPRIEVVSHYRRPNSPLSLRCTGERTHIVKRRNGEE